ncbi:MAG: hypothetical protein ACRDPG_08245 [Nocardioidaceae bacterium]
MSTFSERELAALLHRVVPMPQPRLDRADAVRHRARRVRQRRLAIGAGCVVLAVVAAVPAVASRNNSAEPGGRGPTGVTTTSHHPTGCTPSACTPTRMLAQLRRPLHLPVLAPGHACRVSAARAFASGGGFSHGFAAVGPGPVYMAGSATLSADKPAPRHSSTPRILDVGQKVIWVVGARYDGPWLVRGAQINGKHQLRFIQYNGSLGYSGGPPAADSYRELLYVQGGFDSQPTVGIHTYPTVMQVPVPGCYALQIDGRGFSEILVFRAHRAKTPAGHPGH